MIPTPITKRLRRAQGETGAALTLLHHIGAVELYARQRSRHPLDYAVVRRSRHAHGATPTEVLADMRNHVQAAITESQRPLGWQTGLDAGFTPTCLTGFCKANELDPASVLSPVELRRAVARHPHHYARALRRVGIHVPPPYPGQATNLC